MSEDCSFLVRAATEDDLKAVTRLVVLEGWHYNPYDLACGHAFDPSAFFVGELNGEVISHVSAVKYPGHSAYIGTFMVQKEHRGKGYGKQTWDAAWRSLDHNCTIALDGVHSMISKYNLLGFHSVWNTSIVTIDLNKTVDIFSYVTVPPGVSCIPIRTVNFEKLFKYDTTVFGVSRRTLLEKYINIPGSLGWAAVNENGDVIGYTLVKQVISEAGAKIGLFMAPLYADIDTMARVLLKVAAETYLATDAVEASSFELFYSDGGSYGDHASRLIKQLEANTVYLGQRMYTKGTPPGRQISKMFGLFFTAFD